MMVSYVKYVADKLLYDMGYKKRYGGVNKFEWLELLSLQSKVNFFERLKTRDRVCVIKGVFLLMIIGAWIHTRKPG